MNTKPRVKGWCPGALKPMESGDGLVVRVRPFGGRLRRAQADGLATLSAVHGNGMLDLSSRGNIQLRGVSNESYPALIEGLRHMNLLDENQEAEARRNILVAPFWDVGDETELLAATLAEALREDTAPQIPHKFGFAIDTGPAPVLQTASADIRLERDAQGGLLLVADGFDKGKPLTLETLVHEAMALAEWFVQNRGDQTRMKGLLGTGVDLPEGFVTPRQTQEYRAGPAVTFQGALVGLAFGQLYAETLAALAKHGGLRMTPWRLLLVENAKLMPDITGLITKPDDPLLRVIACTGMTRCPQGHIKTRTLARRLAGYIPKGQLLHVSGCAKGCAHAKAAPLTVTGTPDGLNLVRNGRADGPTAHTDLTFDDLIKVI